MAGTPSQGQRRRREASVGRKPEAKPWSEVHEASMRQPRLGEGARKPKAQKSPSGGGCRDDGWMGRTSRVLPREPCAPACELGRSQGRHDGRAGLSRGRVVAKCSATKGRTDEAEAAPSFRGGGRGRRSQAHPASGENAVDGTMELLDKVLQRENVNSASCPLSRRNSGLHVSSEPPDAERHVRWCGSRGRATSPGYPIFA